MPESEPDPIELRCRTESVRSILTPILDLGMLILLNQSGAFRGLTHLGPPGVLLILGLVILLYLLVPILGLFWGIRSYRYSNSEDRKTRIFAMIGLALNSLFIAFAVMGLANVMRANLEAGG
ncbi:hypothetical protein [Puniceicoccus vermicola]|uniref:Uncharacterized protein n=1 Tax=Puniceicoccus vermicola TaxID=388746 RepID=A0A7X1E2Y8_9BACT|nr:hypothetical protein [Puniceicoccus vermicola]MBC2600516.1 hypothetical protein [Puniceicoccus vermicola]